MANNDIYERIFDYLVEVARNRCSRPGSNPHVAAGYDSRISEILKNRFPGLEERDRVLWIKLARLIFYSQASKEELNQPISGADPMQYDEID